MYPLHPRWTKTGGALVVLGIWVVACGLSSAQLIFSRAVQLDWQDRIIYDCREEWSTDKDVQETVSQIYTVVIFLVTFVLPLLVLAFAYASIAIVLWRRSSPGNANTARDRQQLQDKIKVVKMLALVVAMFAICWLPLQIFNLLVHLLPEFTKYYWHNSVYAIMFFVCHWLSMANSFINPVIYCFMSDNFWGDLRTLLLRCMWVFNGSPRGRCPSSFRSTSYALSFRKNSGTSHGSLQIRRLGDGVTLDRPPGDDPSTRLTPNINGRRNCSVDDCACVIASELSDQLADR